MDSDNDNLPEEKKISFLKRNLKPMGVILILAIIISSTYVYSRGDSIDEEFAKQHAFIPEQSLQYLYVSYLADTGLYSFEVTKIVGENEYTILGSDEKTYNLRLYQEEKEENGQTVMQWYAKLEGTNIESPPQEIEFFFETLCYISTDPFMAIPETVGYEFLDKIYLLFGAWEEAGVENQQLAYGMSEISEAVGKWVKNTKKIEIGEITGKYYIDIYKEKIGTPTKPVIYIMTQPQGAIKNRVVIPKDGIIVIEIPNYQDIRMFCLLVAEIIAPGGDNA
ncbi:MAG: hypothetical protein ACXQTP_05055 [Candidatus Methanofastidiosia archaeon]